MNVISTKDLLNNFIRINTVNPPGNEKGLAVYIASILAENGLSPVIEDLGNNRANLYCEIGRKSDRCIIFNGHLDVVPAEGLWKNDPFFPFEEQGRIYGRGACDMKAGLAAMTKVFLDYSKNQDMLNGVLKLVFVADEETANQGTLHYLQNEKEESDRRLVIIGEPTSLKLCTSHLGAERFCIRVLGKSAHSSNPEKGINAIEGACQVICAIEKYRESLQIVQSEYGCPSVAVTMINGGEKINSIPSECRIFVDRRTLPGETSNAVQMEFKNFISNFMKDTKYKILIDSIFSFESGYIPDSSSIQEIKRIIGCSKSYNFPAGCEQNLFLKNNFEAVILGPGAIDVAHTTNEYVFLQELYDAEQKYRDIVSHILCN